MTSDDVQSPKPDPTPAPVVPRTDFTPDQPVSLRPNEEAATGFFNPDPAPAAAALPVRPDAEPFVAAAETDQPVQQIEPGATELSWTASEFIAHPKNSRWYMALVGAAAGVIALTYLLTRDVIAAVVIAVCAGIFGYSASRQPRQLQYAITEHGVGVGNKFYPYKDFRSFAVIPEGAFSSIDFMPLKRFAPILSIYYDPSHEPQVMDLLAKRLPSSAHKRTMVDALMARIRF